MPYVRSLWMYPLKGARGIQAASTGLSIDESVGVVGDRQFGIKRKPSVPNTWSPKGMFYVGMNTPAMVAQPHTTEEKEFVEKLHIDGGLSVLDTQQAFNLTDTKGPSVSFVNLETIRSLGIFLNRPIDPRRFRMNVWLDGFPALEELTWVNGYPGTREIKVGEMHFRVEDACERCKAIEANPATGIYEGLLVDELSAFMEHRGYPGSPHRNVQQVMGVLARPLTTGTIRVNDKITVLS